jgi:methionyl-tRNA synthetase
MNDVKTECPTCQELNKSMSDQCENCGEDLTE